MSTVETGLTENIDPQMTGRGLTRRKSLTLAGGFALASLLAACSAAAPSAPGPVSPTTAPSTSSAPSVSTAPPTSTAASASVAATPSVNTIKAAVASLGAQTPDPHLAYSNSDTYALMWADSEPLVRRDLNGQHVPNLATEWQTSSDGLIWSFTLRGGVKMQDGSAFTAQDVKTAIDRIRPTEFTFFAPLAAAVASVKVIDDLHVSVTTKKPYATMLDDLPVPIPTDYYNRVGDAQFRKQPLAAGAFKFVSQQVNQGMTFVRFDDFFDKTRLPNFTNLQILVIPDESTRLAALQSGQVDIATNLSATSAQQLQDAKGFRVLRNDDTSLANIYFLDLYTPEKPSPLLDVRVRQAIVYALDRESIAKSLYKGYATVPANVTQQITLGNDSQLKPLPYDPEKAKQLLKDAGQPQLTVTLNSKDEDTALPNVQTLDQALVSYWKAVGINTDLKVYDTATYNTLKNSRKLAGMRIFGFATFQLSEPGYFGNGALLSSSAAASDKDPKLDAIINDLNTTTDEAARSKIGTQFSDYLYENLPVFPALSLPSLMGVGPHVGDWKLQRSNPFLQFWYLRAV